MTSSFVSRRAATRFALMFMMTAGFGTYSDVVLSVAGGELTPSLSELTTQVNDANNRAPIISGVPSTSVQATQLYLFAPQTTDADSNSLSYSIQNKPSWATFNTTNGRLRGTPGVANVGSYANILITVSDGKTAVSLSAFTITVESAHNSSTPTISGTPTTIAAAGTTYSFQPSASDANGDTLSWSITNKPSWAIFSTTTGNLSGTPAKADVGTFANIKISISDGQTTVALAPFTITVPANVPGSAQLMWQAPTQYEDFSALRDLAGFRIVYGSRPNELTQMIDVPGPNATSYTVENLVSGTWYFAVTAYTAVGTESKLSPVASKTVP